jgi:cytoskeleton protein RodZ
MQQVESPAVTLGAYLRSLREAKGSSLEDMARSTRVGIRHLEALEEERLADLPSPVFVRGFIRAYCSFLRESPEAALGHYQELAGERAAAEAAITPPRPRNTGVSGSVLLGVALLLVLGIGLAVLNLTVKRQPETQAATAKMAPRPVPVPAPAPARAVAPPRAAATPAAQPPPLAPAAEPTRPASPPAPSPPTAAAPATPAPPTAPAPTVAPKAAPGSQRLVIKAVEPTWIRVQTDEGRVAEELLPAGASREWTADRRFLVTIGDAGGVELTLNGRSLPPLGAKGTVIRRLELPQQPASGS